MRNALALFFIALCLGAMCQPTDGCAPGATHEHQHVVQQGREGVRFEIAYLSDRAARARWEAEAYRSDLELHHWRTGTVPPPRALANLLLDYGCRPTDVEVAAKSLALSAVAVRQGAVLNEASHVAIAWLDTHLPHLRAKGAS